MDQRGHVEELDRHGGLDQRVGRGIARAHVHEHRAEPLPSGRERARSVRRQRIAVTLRDLLKPRLGPFQERAELGPGGGEDVGELRRARRGSGSPARRAQPRSSSTSPAWIAMIPPAVTIQRTRTSPTAAMAAASPRASGKRRTELGR